MAEKERIGTGTESDGSEMSFLDHLELLRWPLIRSVSVVM